MLFVSTFRPNPDGIALYSDELLTALRPSGRTFVRLGIASGGGDRVRLLAGFTRPLWILVAARGVDDVVVMYIPTYFQRGTTISRAVSLLSLWVVSRLRRATFVLHEPDLPLPEHATPRERRAFRFLERVRRFLWSRARLVFHTEWERQRFVARYPGRWGRVERLAPQAAYSTSIVVPAAQARAGLGLPDGRVIVLMIGFLSPHKRFDRGIAAAAESGRDDLDLHIVGSPISDWPEVEECVADLRERAAGAKNVYLHEQFVSDDDFDMWIRAADAVLVPYGTASSSAVVARAQLLGTRVIASGAGGIAEQLGDSDIAFGDDAELRAALSSLASTSVDGHARA